MISVFRTSRFVEWLDGLADVKGRALIKARIDRMSLGNLGDCKPLDGGLYEARIFYGPGYRLYFIREGKMLIVLLAGGDKSSQKRDIKAAQKLASEWEEQNG